MKKAIFIVLLAGLVIVPALISAQQTSNNSYINPCPVFSRNMTLGSADLSTAYEVSALQNFLVAKGYLNIPVGVSTGYFGNLTRAALANYQAYAGISPAVGYFGPLTRAYIISRCPVTLNVSVSSISPSSGSVGTQVTIYGSGFTQDNRVHFASGGAVHVPSYSNGTVLYFTVPDATGPCDWAGDTSDHHCAVATQQIIPGKYQMSVENTNGTSNTMTFTVTSNNSSVNPVISGVSGPTYLDINQTGTWTVNATDPQNGQLSYSVDWGDKYQCPPSYYCAQPADGGSMAYPSPQQSATFTHSYPSSGTYTQKFTVTNNSGGAAQTTTTVNVGISSNSGSKPSLNYLSPTSGMVGTYVTIYGSGFSANNTVNFGNGIVPNVSSSNGTTLTFRVPDSINPPCAYSHPPCAMPTQQLQPGTYAVSVTSNSSTSNTLYFTVTSGSTF